jgi:hypothetical protein
METDTSSWGSGLGLGVDHQQIRLDDVPLGIFRYSDILLRSIGMEIQVAFHVPPQRASESRASTQIPTRDLARQRISLEKRRGRLILIRPFDGPASGIDSLSNRGPSQSMELHIFQDTLPEYLERSEM